MVTAALPLHLGVDHSLNLSEELGVAVTALRSILNQVREEQCLQAISLLARVQLLIAGSKLAHGIDNVGDALRVLVIQANQLQLNTLPTR